MKMRLEAGSFKRHSILRPSLRTSPLVDLKELDLEDEGGVSGNDGRVARSSVFKHRNKKQRDEEMVSSTLLSHPSPSQDAVLTHKRSQECR